LVSRAWRSAAAAPAATSGGTTPAAALAITAASGGDCSGDSGEGDGIAALRAGTVDSGVLGSMPPRAVVGHGAPAVEAAGRPRNGRDGEGPTAPTL
jgi:hypothetical protein